LLVACACLPNARCPTDRREYVVVFEAVDRVDNVSGLDRIRVCVVGVIDHEVRGCERPMIQVQPLSMCPCAHVCEYLVLGFAGCTVVLVNLNSIPRRQTTTAMPMSAIIATDVEQRDGMVQRDGRWW
jgi:hypothetical protein